MEARSSAASTSDAESEPLLGESRRTRRSRWTVAGGAAFASVALVASASLSGSAHFIGFRMASSLGRDEADAIPAAPSGFVGTYNVHSIVGVRSLFPRDSQVMSLAWDPSLDEWSLVRFNSDTEIAKRKRTLGVADDIASLLREYHPLRFSKGQPPFQILVHSDDSPRISCLKHGECPPEMFAAPVLNVGTEIRDKNVMPNFVDLPMTPLLECMAYRHYGEPDCPLFQNLTEASEAECVNAGSNYCPMHFRPDLEWDDLEDRLIWRGSNLRMASDIPGGMSRAQSIGELLTAIRELEEEGGRERVTALRLLQQVMESRRAGRRITPRLKATLMSAAAREVQAREAERAAEQAAGVGDPETPSTAETWETPTQAAETPSTSDAASLSAAESRLAELAASLRWFDFDALFTPKISDTRDCRELVDSLSKHGIDIFTPERYDAVELSRFRYHIDLGGAGGTTWSGMFAKLAMPGLLFHHETVTTDFFVGNELKPWWHYVPVEQDLSDLPEKLEWARKHPVEAKQIARRGSEFMKSLRDDPLVTEALLETSVRDRTIDVVNQYVHPTGPDGKWMTLREAFYAAGVTPDQLELIPIVENPGRRERVAADFAKAVDESGGGDDLTRKVVP
jgi:hypothetical protein